MILDRLADATRARYARVRVGVHVDLVIEQAAQLRLSQGQNALHDEDGGRLD